ncbi:hypothetical protein CDV31_010109 [Fusarium ambrosium]|uniref:Uncharacterized protein n=1 Tax=Fusarium ambrosium TaxID=131363 RepID=A0A428TQ98_9HYPO|nr:hypothetical protein CDV31_010109 [Fusarium ambrosium]
MWIPNLVPLEDWPPRPWVPLPDPRRPDFPYHSGLTLKIRPHTPPHPFGLTGYTKGPERRYAAFEEVAKVSQSEWCLRNPLAETPPHPNATETQTLEIVQGIASKDGRGAQIVRCYLGEDKNRSYVAKIYDPLYYSYADREFGSPVDVTYMADSHYSREAAAFEDLKAAGVDGQFTPKYYGSWTFDMGLPGTSEVRPVRLVLLEWLNGVDLWSIMERDGTNNGIHTMPPEKRLEIFAKAAEAETNVTFHRVLHRDFSPRNVMIVDAATSEGVDSHTPRVVLIDFNNSTCIKRPNFRDRQFYNNAPYPLPVSPRYNWWGGCPNEFLHWVPDPHRSDDAVFNGWLEQRWPDPSTEYFLPPFKLPRHRATAKLIEYASPVPDTEPVFVQVYSRRYSLPSVGWSSDGGNSPSELGEAKSSRSRDDSGESDPPRSGNGSPRSGSEPDGTSPSQGTLGGVDK